MTESSWPFDSADTTEAQYSYLLRLISDSGVLGSPASGDLKPYADSTGMFVKVPGGMAVVRGFFYLNDAVLTLAVAAASSQARVDSVVLRLDPTANTIRVVVKAGTPGSTSGPALTTTDSGVYEYRLADFTVPANATTIAASNVTDRRVFASDNWGRWTTDRRPAVPEGKAGYNFTTRLPEYWDGSAWRSFSTTTTDAGALTTGFLLNARLDYGVLAAIRGDRTVDAPVVGDMVSGDWNAVLQPGVYRIFQGNTNMNMPTGAYPYGTLVVFGAGASIQSRTQAYFEHGAGTLWTRTAWNGTDWNTWRATASSGDVATATQRIATEEQNRANADGALAGRLTNVEKNPKIRYGKVTATGFTYNPVLDRYIKGVAVVLNPPMTGATNIALFGTAISQDPVGVIVNQDPDTFTGPGGGTLIVTRRNDFSTAINWMAVGT
jgi:hypothetical protein